MRRQAPPRGRREEAAESAGCADNAGDRSHLRGEPGGDELEHGSRSKAERNGHDDVGVPVLKALLMTSGAVQGPPA